MKNDNIITYSNSGRYLQQQALFLVIRGKNKHIIKFFKPRYVSAGIIALQKRMRGSQTFARKEDIKWPRRHSRERLTFYIRMTKGRDFMRSRN